MQSGMFAGKKSTLIVMNHFDVDEALISRIKETGVFDEVVLFDSNNKTKLNRFKRLVNVFAPTKLMRKLANGTTFTHFVCFALDFSNLSYLMQRYEKRGIACEFSFGDDGIGTYIREGIYKPNDLVRKLLTACRRLDVLDRVRRVYAYKPEFMVANRGYDLHPIAQSEAACANRRQAVCRIWSLSEDVNIDNGILYFEQPNEADKDSQDQKIEQASLQMAIEALRTHSVVKLHPRSTAEEQWRAFGILKTKMPYEVMLLQKQCAPALMMTVNSTALFSTYLFDDLPAASCPSVLLYKLMLHQNEKLTSAMNSLCAGINGADKGAQVYAPETMDQLQQYLKEKWGK